MASVVALLVTPVKSPGSTGRTRARRAVGRRRQPGLLPRRAGRPAPERVEGDPPPPADRRLGCGADRLSIAFPNGLVAEGSGQADGRPITTSFSGRRVSAKEVDARSPRRCPDYVGKPVLLARPDGRATPTTTHRCRCARRPPPRSWPASRESPRRLTSGGSGCWSWWTAPNRTRRMPGAAGRSGWARHGSRSTGVRALRGDHARPRGGDEGPRHAARAPRLIGR